MRQVYNSKIGVEDDLVDKLFNVEDFARQTKQRGNECGEQHSDSMFRFRLACCRVLARDSGPESQAGLRSERDHKPGSQQSTRRFAHFLASRKAHQYRLRSSEKGGVVTMERVERRMEFEKGLEKARKATATPPQTVEPGKRRFR